MAIEPPIPGFFWYGIHSVEMLYAALGKGCVQVRTLTTPDYDLIIGKWADGRIGTVRGNRTGNQQFGATLHFTKGSRSVDVYANPKPYYASLLEKVMQWFQTGKADIEMEETLELIRFIEAANESRETGQPVTLEGSI
jgi:predicted dehydrogenase